MSIYLKACVKCHGDVAELSDIYGPYFDCLQCGQQPKSIAMKGNQKNVPISIDKNIELLWILSSQKPISSEGHPLTASLEKRLKDLEQHQYVLMEGTTESSGSGNYKMTPKGTSVVDEYRSFISKVEEGVKSIKGSSFVISYQLVDEDGKLTLMGKYAVKTSKTLSEFIEDIYPMAAISLENLEPTSPPKQ